MKIYILTMLITLLPITFPSYSDDRWEYVGASIEGNKFYINLDSIKRDGGYVYYLSMHNRIKKDKWGSLSITSLKKVDCKNSKFQNLEINYYKRHWAISFDGQYKPDWGWKTPKKDGMNISYLELACNYIK